MFGLKDIARLANTSPATVSRILRNPERRCADPALRERVLEIAKKNGYLPNSDARKLRSGAKFQVPQRKISCFLARTKTDAPGGDQFFSSLARVVEQEAIMQGFALGFSYSASRTDDLLSSSPEDQEETGLIVLGRPDDSEMVPKLQRIFPYLVFAGLQRFDDCVDQVVADGHHAAMTALNYLFSLGHREIAYIGETVRELRYNGYLDFMQSKGLDCAEHLIAPCIYHSYDEGYNAALELMTRPRKATAIFCANDLTAFGVLNALHSIGYRVPEDISVISIDNVELAQFTTPMLTTIQIPQKEIGHFAVSLLLNKMDHILTDQVSISLPCQLVIRNSCRRLT